MSRPRDARHAHRVVRARRVGGQPVAVRALAQVRLLAVAVVLVGAARYRPAGLAPASRDLALALAGAGAAVLLLVSVLCSRAARSGTGRPQVQAALSTGVDAVVTLGMVWTAGLPPHSFALVLLVLPLLEATLWFGLAGLAGVWTTCSLVLGALLVSLPGDAPAGAPSTLLVALPTLLLAILPLAVLTEHLVSEVGRLTTARETADDRARLLGDLSATSADLVSLDADAVLTQLVAGAERLGAGGAVVVAAVGDDGTRLASAGDQRQVQDAVRAAGDRAPQPGTHLLAADGLDCRALVVGELAVRGGSPCTFAAVVAGSRDRVDRRAEALELLVAQARVSLANAVLVRQLEELKQTYAEQATRDQLTGLLNRRGLVLHAEQLPGPLGVLFCDLDGFKGVNDTLGHAAGDELLDQVARRLARGLPPGALLARMGGDEFAVVVSGATQDALTALGADVAADVGRPFALAAGTAQIGVSIGTAQADPGEHDLTALLDHADQLMYDAKRRRQAEGHHRAASTGARA